MPHRRTALLTAALAATTLATLAPSASAGTYPMRTCNVPGYAPASTGPWEWTNAELTQNHNGCASGAEFGFTFPNLRSMGPNTAAYLTLNRPNAGARQAIGIKRLRLWMTARLSGSGSQAYLQVRGFDGNDAMQQTGIFGPEGGNTLVTPYDTPVYGDDTKAVQLALFCSSSAGTDCVLNDRDPLLIRGAEATLFEDVPPTASVDGGSLLNGEVQRGARSVAYSAADGESGVGRVEVRLDDTVVGVSDLTADPAQCDFNDWSACVTSRSESIAVDTTRVPDGRYTASLRVLDAAGNARQAEAPGQVTVDNVADPAPGPAPAPAPNPSPAAAPAAAAAQPAATSTLAPVRGPANGANASDDARLSVAFLKTERTAYTTTYGRRVTLRGKLVTGAGRPIGNAKVEVLETPATRGARPLDKGGARTRPDGTFRYTVARNASSRALRFQYRSHLGDVEVAAAKTMQLRVRAKSTLKVALRGAVVRYSGRVTSGPLPKGGKLVVVQGRVRGGSWQTFATRQARGSGRFSGRYRLRVRRPGTRLQFRVRVPSEGNYPYLTTVGRPVTKTVR